MIILNLMVYMHAFIKKKNTNRNLDLDNDWQVSVTKYGSDKELTPTFFPYEIYQYSDTMLKHLPRDALKTIKKHICVAKKLSITMTLT